MTDQVRFEHAERVRDFYRNQGAAKEKERIIELLENNNHHSVDWLIQLIKGETE
jgi:hypothetical protein